MLYTIRSYSSIHNVQKYNAKHNLITARLHHKTTVVKVFLYNILTYVGGNRYSSQRIICPLEQTSQAIFFLLFLTNVKSYQTDPSYSFGLFSFIIHSLIDSGPAQQLAGYLYTPTTIIYILNYYINLLYFRNRNLTNEGAHNLNVHTYFKCVIYQQSIFLQY